MQEDGAHFEKHLEKKEDEEVIPEQVADGEVSIEEDPTLMPLKNDRHEAEVRGVLRDAKGDKETLQKLIQESEAIITRGRSVSIMNKMDRELILKHERRIALAQRMLNGEHVAELAVDRVKEEARVELLNVIKKAKGLDVLRQLATEHLGEWDASVSAKMVLFANEPRSLGRYIAALEAQVYEMDKNSDTDPIKLLEKKYQLAYAKAEEAKKR